MADLQAAIDRGARAAAWAGWEQAGRLHSGLIAKDDDVLARFRFVDNDGVARDLEGRLVHARAIPELGGTIEEIGAPHSAFLVWCALAYERVDDGGAICTWAWDLRGIGALPLSEARNGELGREATKHLLRTSIPAAAGRQREAVRRLGGDDRGKSLAGLAAGAAFEYLRDRAGSDGGAPVTGWVMHGYSQNGAIELIGASRTPAADEPDHRGRVSNAVASALEQEAFGVGVNSPRGKHEHVPILDDDALHLALVEQGPEGAVLRRLEAADLTGRAGLTARELEVFELRRLEGLRIDEVARRLGTAEGTVKATLHHAEQKLREVC